MGKRKGSGSGSDYDENDSILAQYTRIDTETKSSYDSLAAMMETQDMKTIMNLFSEKILMNLIYSNHGH